MFHKWSCKHVFYFCFPCCLLQTAFFSFLIIIYLFLNAMASVGSLSLYTMSWWKHFPRYWPFVRRIHRSPVNSPHKGQWRGALMSSLICTWINSWINNPAAGDLRRHRAHCDVSVMCTCNLEACNNVIIISLWTTRCIVRLLPMITSRRGNVFRIIGSLWRRGRGGVVIKRFDISFNVTWTNCCTVEFPVIWEAVTQLRSQCNVAVLTKQNRIRMERFNFSPPWHTLYINTPFRP